MKTKTIFAAAIAAIAICSQTVARAAVPEVDWETTITEAPHVSRQVYSQ